MTKETLSNPATTIIITTERKGEYRCSVGDSPAFRHNRTISAYASSWQLDPHIRLIQLAAIQILHKSVSFLHNIPSHVEWVRVVAGEPQQRGVV
mmetsp:Transcript_19653/g.26978  ORF Transcript_19653/g.26978 Transcript_19653/m.26978 type:complete len:94 (-) Transcript_19653:503-784(-)